VYGLDIENVCNFVLLDTCPQMLLLQIHVFVVKLVVASVEQLEMRAALAQVAGIHPFEVLLEVEVQLDIDVPGEDAVEFELSEGFEEGVAWVVRGVVVVLGLDVVLELKHAFLIDHSSNLIILNLLPNTNRNIMIFTHI
jgi:hypothetical protein